MGIFGAAIGGIGASLIGVVEAAIAALVGGLGGTTCGGIFGSAIGGIGASLIGGAEFILGLLGCG